MTAARTCLGAVLALLLLVPGARAQETCGDCRDDDADGAVDCWDRDCRGTPACGSGPLGGRTESALCDDRTRLQRLWAADLGGAYLAYAVGDIDADGMPEVVFMGGEWKNEIFVLDGATGSLEGHLELGLPHTDLQASIADVDGDGTGEIFVGRPYGTPSTVAISRFEHDLTETYRFLDHDPLPNVSLLPADLGFADFDHDGRPEVYNMGLIHDPADGSVLVDLGWQITINTSSHSFAADMFPDEACELCAGLELVGSSGVWAVDVATGSWAQVGSYEGGLRRGTFAVADWNGDGLLDIAANINRHAQPPTAARGELFVWDPRTGAALTPVLPNEFGYSSSVPSIANFDDDPEPELLRIEPAVFSLADNRLVLRDNDLSVLWMSEGVENSAWTTAVLFDFNSDGVPDIAHRGVLGLQIHDGRDGSLIAEADCLSGTATERLIVADVNADGQADILSGCVSPAPLIAWTVPRSPPARQVMNQYQYYPVVIDDDLTVPCRQQQHAAGGIPPFLNGSIQQAPLLREGLTPAEECRGPLPVQAPSLAPEAICAGEEVLLDASSASGCITERLYRWLDDTGAVACDWSSSPTCLVSPSRSTTYQLTVACSEDRWCHERAQVRVDVTAAPIADAGPDRVICEGESVMLHGSLSTGPCPRLEYRWRDEAAVLRDWSTISILELRPGRSRTYTLDVRCPEASECVVSDAIEVRLDESPPGEPVGAILRAADGTESSVRFDWCRGRVMGPFEHAHLYRSEDPDQAFTRVAPSPHSSTFRDCEWTDEEAPGALYFYDLRYANCSELVTESPWRDRP